MFQYKSNSLPVKRNLISNIANWLYESSQELPNDIRLIFFGKQEILANSQVWLKTQPSAESPLNKTNFDNSSQKNPQKQTTNARDTVQFYQISLLCFKYYAHNCSMKKKTKMAERWPIVGIIINNSQKQEKQKDFGNCTKFEYFREILRTRHADFGRTPKF